MKTFGPSKTLFLSLTIVFFFGFLLSCDDDDEVPAPEVISISPESAQPNTLISIVGNRFSPVFSDNMVSFSGKAALVVNSSSTQLNVVVPGDAVTGPVAVTVRGKSAANQPVFTVIPLPVEIQSMSPSSGGYNTTVTFAGKNFNSLASGNSVLFNGRQGVVESASANSLSVRVPAKAGTGPVTINGVAAGTFTYRPEVYVAGHLYDESGYSRASYWKNGSPVTLSKVGFNTYAYDITVVNDDVYVVGDRYLGTHSAARLWKNGTEIPLTDDATPSHAAEIYVSGEDVYVVGSETKGKLMAVYWKNGNRVSLTDGSAHATASSIVVNGSDIYAAGNSTHANGNTVATYWKNGTPTTISEKVTFAHGMFISGTDIYLTGSERNTGPGVGFPTYWKNGTPVYLGPGLGGAAGYDIIVVGNDVYAAGVEDNAQAMRLAKYWKNGFPVALSDGSRPSFASAIDVIGDDVYVVGHEYNGANRTVVKLWKNGQPISITDGGYFAGAEGIFIR